MMVMARTSLLNTYCIALLGWWYASDLQSQLRKYHNHYYHAYMDMHAWQPAEVVDVDIGT